MIDRKAYELAKRVLEKWWKVPRGRPLSAAQQRKAVDFLMAWIERNMVS